MNRLLIVFVYVILFSPCLVAQDEDKERIDSSDINVRYEIIGPLGYPLGKLIDIEAEVLPDPGKGEANWLSVVTVNGRRLDKPVKITYRFWGWSKGLRTLGVGETYKLRVFQNGGMAGVPPQVMKETVQVQACDYHFRVEVVIIRASPR